MTIHYGAIVGQSEAPTVVRPIPVPFGYHNTTDEVLYRDTLDLAAAPAADQVHLGYFGWDSIIDADTSFMHFDALGAGVTLAIGDVTFPAALNAATAASAAGQFNIGVAPAIGARLAPLWKVLGYASEAAAKLIGVRAELFATIAGGAATGNLAWTVRGVPCGSTWQPT